MNDINTVLHGSPYQSYLYSYPHKTSYRPFERPQSLAQTWQDEDRGNLFLYLHIPFCEMRCGFCNLFTSAKPRGGCGGDIVTDYIDALERQAACFREAMPDASFARLALGGGTPTYLSPEQIERLFAIAKRFDMDLATTPCSVETSPETATADRLAVLRDNHVDRVSIGVQSFVDEEVRSVGRAQKREEVCKTLTLMREMRFQTLNIDLMYGLPGQSQERWRYSLDQALYFAPEEVYLYPLYVRPLTGVSRLSRSWDDERLDLYRYGRDYLCQRGYEQVSMRMFRKSQSTGGTAPVYCCQEDGMVGLGPGARSYTRSLHYSSEYAVGASGVRGIIADFSSRSNAQLAQVNFGARLDLSEEKRRFTILSLLHINGLDTEAYVKRFGVAAADDFPELAELQKAGLARQVDSCVRLSEAGFERADAIGPWLHSVAVQDLMAEYELR